MIGYTQKYKLSVSPSPCVIELGKEIEEKLKKIIVDLSSQTFYK